jgi:hypothetical protein
LRRFSDGQDVAEDVDVGLHSFGGPETSSTVQSQKLKVSGIGDCAIRGSSQLQFNRHRLLDLKNVDAL